MLRAWLNLCRRPALRFGLRRDPGGRFRDPRFVSFLSLSNRKLLKTDRHDAILRGRQVVRRLLWLAAAGGGAWIVLESAQAISVF